MTRGTAYAALEIVLWLLAAGLVGVLIGWFLRRWLVDRHVEEQIHALRTDEERRRGKLQLELAAAQTQSAAATADLERRRADLDRANARIDERDKTIADLESQMTGSRSETMKLESKVEDRESTIASLRSSIGKEERQLAGLRKEVDSANGTIGALRNDAEGYRSTIEALRADLDAERRKHTDLADKLETASATATTKESALVAARDTQEKLIARVAELEAAASHSSGTTRHIAELEANLETAMRQRDQLTAELDALQLDHAGCADQSPVTAPIAEAEPEPAAPDLPDPLDAPVEVSDKDEAVAMVAEIARRTRGDGPAVDDDLKKIRGVGPKLDRLLKSMDITSFRQVANFTPDDIQHVTAALEAFPGRIERDDWMSSAAEQHAAKYDEPA